MVPTLELNFALFSLFLTLSILFFMLAGGIAATVWTRIGGWWGLVVAGIAFYIAAAGEGIIINRVSLYKI